MSCERSLNPSGRSARATLTATMLSPPRAKKSSSTLTFSTPRIVAKMSHRSCSCGVRGAMNAPCRVGVIAGSPRRSTLPLAVMGKASRTIRFDGTM